MGAYRDTDAEKIQERRWDDIRDEWKNYVPDHDSPWPVPELEIHELETLEKCLDNLGGPQKRDSTFEEEILGLRVAALQESVILIHKAGNVLRAAASEGRSGYRTWCRSSAYHSAFFAMRGVLGLLGVILFRDRDRRADFQLDLWAPRVQRKRPGLTESRFAVRLIRRKQKVEHKALWGVFSRVLRVTRIDRTIWPLLEVDPLKSIDPGQCSYLRHQIHYRSAGWLFHDLDSSREIDDFGNLGTEIMSLKHLRQHDASDFPMGLALHTLSLGIALMEDLGASVPKVAAEARRAQRWMDEAPWKCANAFALREAEQF